MQSRAIEFAAVHSSPARSLAAADHGRTGFREADAGRRRRAGSLADQGSRYAASSSLPPIRSPSMMTSGVVDAMLFLECLDLVARGEQLVVELDAGILEHPPGQQAIGAFVVGQLHSIEDGGTLGHGDTRCYGCEWRMPGAGEWLLPSR